MNHQIYETLCCMAHTYFMAWPSSEFALLISFRNHYHNCVCIHSIYVYVYIYIYIYIYIYYACV